MANLVSPAAQKKAGLPKKAAPKKTTSTPVNKPGTVLDPKTQKGPIKGADLTPKTPPPTNSIPNGGLNPDAPNTQTSADQVLIALFRSYGLESLAASLLDYAKNGVGQDEAYLRLQETDAWKQRFIGNETRLKRGLSVLSPAEYLAKEASLRAQFREYGLPAGFYDEPSDYARAIGADLGAQELGQRLAARKAIVEDGKSTGVLKWAQDTYGLGDGDLLAFFTDPDRAAPLLERMARAAQVGSAGGRTGYGTVDRSTAERLADLGVSGQQAQEGFAQAAELSRGLDDQVSGDPRVSRDEAARALLEGDIAARRKIDQAQSARRARFDGGGGFAEGRDGFRGLGSANT